MIVLLTGSLAKRAMEYIGLGKIWSRISVSISITDVDKIVSTTFTYSPTVSGTFTSSPTVSGSFTSSPTVNTTFEG